MATVEEIARKIAGIASANLAAPDFHLQLHVFAANIRVPSRQATILSLVLNETVSNVFKHSFDGRKEGRLLIGAAQHDGLITISVADDGPGLPAGFDVESSESLGLSLVRTLVQADLRGAFTLRRSPLPPDLLQSWAADGLSEPGGTEEGKASDASEHWTVAEIQFAASSLPQRIQPEAANAS